MSTNNLKYAFTCSTELALVGGGIRRRLVELIGLLVEFEESDTASEEIVSFDKKERSEKREEKERD